MTMMCAFQSAGNRNGSFGGAFQRLADFFNDLSSRPHRQHTLGELVNDWTGGNFEITMPLGKTARAVERTITTGGSLAGAFFAVSTMNPLPLLLLPAAKMCGMIGGYTTDMALWLGEAAARSLDRAIEYRKSPRHRGF